MAELVRVRIGENETTVGRAFAKAHGLTALDEPTHSHDGRLLADTRRGRRQKPKTTVASAAAKKAVTSSAENKKEQDQ